MHVIDAGPAWDSGSCIVVMQCKKCDLKTAWFEIKTVTEAKRGIRCPNCNVIDFETNELGEFIVPDSYK